MSGTGTIIIASDLTARSDRATDRGLLLAREWGAPLVLLHVVEGEWSDAVIEERAVDALQAVLESDASEAEVIVRRGEVQQAIVTLAAERSAALIVTGVARYNNVRDFFLGTAVDHLVRHSPAPVLVVKRRARRPYRRILVATDFSPCSELALRAAAELFPQAAFTVWHNCHAAYETWLDKEETAIEAIRQAEEDMRRFVETAGVSGEVRSGLRTEIGSRAAELLNDVASDVLMVRGPRRLRPGRPGKWCRVSRFDRPPVPCLWTPRIGAQVILRPFRDLGDRLADGGYCRPGTPSSMRAQWLG